jgi:hypothetical protein
MSVGTKVIHGLWTPKMFVNFNKSHYLYFMHLNTFFFSEKEFIGFTRLSKDSTGSMAQKELRTLALNKV